MGTGFRNRSCATLSEQQKGQTVAVERISYRAGNAACNGALVYDERASGRRPLLLMAPNWLGVTDDSIKRAATMAGSKYVAFVADMYGGGKIPAGSKFF